MPGIFFFRDFVNGKILTLPNGRPDLPSYTEMKKFSNGNSRWGPDHGVDIHHSVDKSLQEKWFLFQGNPDDVPGFVIDNKVHTFGPQRGLSGTLTGDIFAAIKANNIALGDHKALAAVMKKVYEDYGFFDLWVVAPQTLISKGVNPSMLP